MYSKVIHENPKGLTQMVKALVLVAFSLGLMFETS
jgi:hypothetical protein